MKKEIDLSNFNFDDFKSDALAQLKDGQPLTGKDGVSTPLIKALLESALEGEMDAHLTDCRDDGVSNRRNGNSSRCSDPVLGKI